MADPNWMLSSIAQSSAAIVAIVGGLIASRVLGIRAQYQLSLERLHAVDDELLIARVTAFAAEEALLEHDADELLWDSFVPILASELDFDVEVVLELRHPSRSSEEMRPYVRRVREMVEAIRSGGSSSLGDLLRLPAVAALAEAARIGGDPAAKRPVRPERDLQMRFLQRTELIMRREQVRAEVLSLTREQRRLPADSGKPALGFERGAMACFVVALASGTGTPIVLMSTGPTELSSIVVWAGLLSFGLSMAAVVLFVSMALWPRRSRFPVKTEV